MDNNAKGCRLCLEIITNNNVEMLDSLKLEMLKIVLPDLIDHCNWVICSKCSSKLQQSFNFKTSCLDNNDYLKTFIPSDNSFVLDLKEIITKEIINEVTVKCEEENICRFCLKYFSLDSFTKLNKIEEDIFLKDMLTKCLPEIDLNISKDNLSCDGCMEQLQHQFNFIINCLDVNERIKNYTASISTDIDQINVIDVLNFNSKCLDANTLKMDEDGENSNAHVFQKIFIKTEEEFEEIGESDFHCKFETTGEGHDEINSDGNIDMEKKLIPILDDVKNSEGMGERDQDLDPEALQQNSKGMYVCSYCPHQTNRRDSLVTHFLTHKKLEEACQFKCDECDFITKWQSSLRSHLLLHKNPKEIQMYYCANCSYKSMHKKHVRRHCKMHMTAKGSPTYQCQFCSFKTKDKVHFKNHNLDIHNKNVMLADQSLRCRECDYLGRNRRNLAIHMKVMHNVQISDSPPTEYSCESCDYKTLKLAHFQGHSLTHKSCDEVKMYNCSECSFQTKYKNSVKTHSKIHQSGEKPKKASRKVKRKTSTATPKQPS